MEYLEDRPRETNPAEEVLEHAAQEIRTMVMAAFGELAPNMRPMSMATARQEEVAVKGFVVSAKSFGPRSMVVLTEQGLNRYPSRQLRTSGKLVPQLPADTPWAAETPKDTNQLWLAHGAKAMELLMTERRYQEWLERHSDLSQAAKDARYIWDFELWLRPNGETAPLGSIPAGLMGAMAVYGYDREVALHGWREIGIDIEDIEDQQRKDLERLWEDVGLSRPQN